MSAENKHSDRFVYKVLVSVTILLAMSSNF